MSVPARNLTTARPVAPPKRGAHLRLVHSRGRQPHGTRARYVKLGCRCSRCRAANAAYWRTWRRRPPAAVPAGPVREHLDWLAEHGIGARQVAERSGVDRSLVRQIRSGRRRSIAVATAERLLDVTHDDVADGALVDAAGAHRHVELLVAAGRSRSWIARELGAAGRALRLGERTTVSRARAIEQLARREGVLR